MGRFIFWCASCSRTVVFNSRSEKPSGSLLSSQFDKFAVATWLLGANGSRRDPVRWQYPTMLLLFYLIPSFLLSVFDNVVVLFACAPAAPREILGSSLRVTGVWNWVRYSGGIQRRSLSCSCFLGFTPMYSYDK